MKKVAADVSKAKAHEAYVNYKADRKVARAVAHAMKHSGGHLEKSLAAAPGLGGVAVAGAALAGLESAHISGEKHTPQVSHWVSQQHPVSALHHRRQTAVSLSTDGLQPQSACTAGMHSSCLQQSVSAEMRCLS